MAIKLKTKYDVAVKYGKGCIFVTFARSPDPDVVKELQQLSKDYPSILLTKHRPVFVFEENMGSECVNSTDYHLNVPDNFDVKEVAECINECFVRDHHLSVIVIEDKELGDDEDEETFGVFV